MYLIYSSHSSLSMPMTNPNATVATNFLQMIIKGEIDQAYEQYVDMTGKHHNVFTPTGFAALRDGMKDNEVQMPNKEFTIKHVVSDGDMVAVHSHLVLKKDMPEMTVVHMFRIVNGKIVELWDIGQQIPADCPNADGAF